MVTMVGLEGINANDAIKNKPINPPKIIPTNMLLLVLERFKCSILEFVPLVILYSICDIFLLIFSIFFPKNHQYQRLGKEIQT